MPRTSLRVSRLDSQVGVLDLLPIVEPDNFVSLLECGKRRIDGLGCPFALEGGEGAAHGVNRRPLRLGRVNSNPIAHLLESLHREHRCFSAFENVYQ